MPNARRTAISTPFTIIFIAWLFATAGINYGNDPTGFCIACGIGSAGFALGLMRLRKAAYQHQRKWNLRAILLGLPLVIGAGFILAHEVPKLF